MKITDKNYGIRKEIHSNPFSGLYSEHGYDCDQIFKPIDIL